MTNLAFIPVRGGSKSIPLKNIKELFGKPLVYWTAKAADSANCIDEVIIATDSDEIKKVVQSFCLCMRTHKKQNLIKCREKNILV